VDPNWNSVTGFGALDLYAARLELTSANRSQVRRLVVDAGESSLEAELWTQRERGAAHFVLEVAPDQGGAPGPFTPADSVAAGGDSLLTNSNLQAYPLSLAIAPADRGLPFWYRVAFTENGVRWSEPARRIVHPVGPSLARIEVRIVHNAYDHDVSASVEVEGGFGPGASGSPAISIPLPGTNSAVSSDWVSGTSTLGNIAWDYELVVPAGAAGAFLPPSSANPWVLEVGEGGYLNRSGRIERFRIVWHATGGDVIYEGGPAPVQTVEGGTVQSWVPAPSLDVEPTVFERGFRATPSPVRSGGDVTFAAPGFAGGDVHIFDLGGREVGRVALAPGLNQARWNARSRAGDPLSAGVYFARAGRFSARLVVLSP
jgi:hypothetical protein